jgi:hypothetical protein
MGIARVTIALVAALGAAAAGSAAPAQEVTGAVAPRATPSPEVSQAALGIVDVLEAIDPGEGALGIATELNRHLSKSELSDGDVSQALALVLEGEWTDDETAALRSVIMLFHGASAEARSDGEGPSLEAEPAAALRANVESEFVPVTDRSVSRVLPERAVRSAPTSPRETADEATAADGAGAVESAPNLREDFGNLPPAPVGGGGSDYET